MSTDFTPTQNTYKSLGQFRFWCQKVLPLVYDDSISYYELLGKVVNYLNETISNMELVGEDMTKVYTAYEQLQTWVNGYFDNLDVQTEINNKLDILASNGTLTGLIKPLIPTEVTAWLNANVTGGSGVIDSSLSVSGASADALTVGKSIFKRGELVWDNADVYFNVDSTAKSITTLSVLYIFYNNLRYVVEKGTVTTYDDTVSKSQILVYDVADSAIKCVTFNAYDKLNHIVIFAFNTFNLYAIPVPIRYTVNGLEFEKIGSVASVNFLTRQDEPIALDFDTVNNTITFITPVVLVYDREQYTVESGTVVSFDASGSGNKVVVWNYNTDEIKVVLATENTHNCAVVFMFQLNYLGTNKALSVNEKYTVNGVKPYDDSEYNVAVVNVLTSGNRPVGLNFNTVDSTLEFLTQTVVVHKRKQYIIPIGTKVSYTATGSTTKVVVWYPSTNEIKAIFTEEYTNDCVILFIFQTNFLTSGSGVGLDTTYSVNGVVIGAKSEGGYSVTTLTGNRKEALAITTDTIIYGNGYSIDLGTRLTGEFVGGIATIPYEAGVGSNLAKVFIDKTLPLESANASKNYYYVTIWGVDKSEPGNSVILTPYETVEEVNANDLSFTYVDGNFVIHVNDNVFDEIVLASEIENCLSANNCNIKVYDVNFLFANGSCVQVHRCGYEFHGCTFGYSTKLNGFDATYSSGVVENCVAFKANNDGFNYHYGYANTMLGCRASHCADDGVSHHEPTAKFTIIGGEFSYNGKGGVASPTYECVGEIHGCYLHDNGFGIYAVNETGVIEGKPIMVSDCLIVDNTVGIRAEGYNVIGYHNTIKDNSTDTTGTVVLH